MRALYVDLNQVESVFSSEVIILPNKLKKYLEIQRPLILSASDTLIKILKFSGILPKNATSVCFIDSLGFFLLELYKK